MRESRKMVLKSGIVRVPLNTIYTIESNQTFTVPETGLWDIELHGGGGGSGGDFRNWQFVSYSYGGGGGGGSGQLYSNVSLTKNAQYACTIGQGGTAGIDGSYTQNDWEDWVTINSTDGQQGGTTSFGALYSLTGGYGGLRSQSTFYATGTGGNPSGSLGSAGGTGSQNFASNSPIPGTPGEGNTSNTSQTYGDGVYGTTGRAGAIKLTLKSYA